MPLETATYIDGLNASNPAASDAISTADDHLRLIKSTIKATFPNITGPVTATQAAINGAAPLASPTFTGTPAAPTASPGTNTTQLATTAFVTAADTAAISAERTASATLTNKTISGASNTISNLSAANLSSGTIPDARFPATLPAASGANLTALNASQLTTGTVSTARMAAGTIVKVSSIVFTTRTVTSSVAVYDLSLGSFTKTYDSSTSDIFIVGTIPYWNAVNDGSYINLKVGSTAKYTGISQAHNNHGVISVTQFWTGLGSGSQSVSTGWNVADGGTNRPINVYCPNSTDDAKNQQTGIELIIYEVLK
jgi:hypothetical protein